MNEPWTSVLRKTIPNVEMRADFRDQLRRRLDDAWEQPTVAPRSRGRFLAAAAALALIVGLIAALMVERSRNDEAPVAGPTPNTEPEPVSSAALSPATTSASESTITDSTATTPTSATAETEAPRSTNVEKANDLPDGAVRVEQPELPASALFQVVVGEDGRAVTIEVTTMRAYDPADLCSRFYEVDFTESTDRVAIDLVPYRPPGDPPQGCRTIGERRQFVIDLREPLGERELLFQGQVIDLSR